MPEYIQTFKKPASTPARTRTHTHAGSQYFLHKCNMLLCTTVTFVRR